MTIDLHEAAKRICVALGQDPDELVYVTSSNDVELVGGTYEGNTVRGFSFEPRMVQTRLYTSYIKDAREALTRKAADDVIKEMLAIEKANPAP